MVRGVGLSGCTGALSRPQFSRKTETQSIQKIKYDLMTNLKKANSPQEIEASLFESLQKINGHHGDAYEHKKELLFTALEVVTKKIFHKDVFFPFERTENVNAAITKFKQQNNLSHDQVVTLLDITQAFRVSRKEASPITRNFHSNFNYKSSFLSDEISFPNTHGGVKNALYMTYQDIGNNFEIYPPTLYKNMNANDFFIEAQKHGPLLSQDPTSGYSAHQVHDRRGRSCSPGYGDQGHGVWAPFELETTMDDQVSETKEIQQLIGNFLDNPVYDKEQMPWGMLFLAQKLDEENFKKCINFILDDHIWIMHDCLFVNKEDISHRDAFIKELQGFQEPAFIQKLRDNDENAKRKLLTHFTKYEGDGGWMIRLEKGSEITGMWNFLARFKQVL